MMNTERIQEIDATFKRNPRLYPKIIASATAAVAITWSAFESFALRGDGIPFWAYPILALVLIVVCGITTAVLFARDRVQADMMAGTRVGLFPRLFLASGMISLLLWIAMFIIVCFGLTIWIWGPWW